MHGLRVDVYTEVVAWLNEQSNEPDSVDMDAVIAAQQAAKRTEDA